MTGSHLFHTVQRYRTLQTDRIHALPIVILMPHSACNCRCVMCDIWKDNKNLKQLTEADVGGLLDSLRRLGTRMVLMSGGEALLNRHFFSLCEMLRREGIQISLLSTGLSIERHADELLQHVDDLIVSLDGDEQLHDHIRQIPGAFRKLSSGVAAIRQRKTGFPVSGRTVIHRLNFKKWPDIIRAAQEIGLDHISFLPADVSSEAFNRTSPWEPARQEEIHLREEELPVLQSVIDHILVHFEPQISSGFIRESAAKLQQIYEYYAAGFSLNPYPKKKCNAPWVSAVVEADGAVKPCFFHPSMGNIRTSGLREIINSDAAIAFRKSLDMDTNDTCRKCVCSLHLSPRTAVGQSI